MRFLKENTNKYWEDNGYKQHVWVTFENETEAQKFINNFGKPAGKADTDSGIILDYYFNGYDEAQNFTSKIPSNIEWDVEETDEDSDYNESLKEWKEPHEDYDVDWDSPVVNALYTQICDIYDKKTYDAAYEAIDKAYESGDICSPDYNELRIELDNYAVYASPYHPNNNVDDDADGNLEEKLNKALGLKNRR